MTYKLLEHAHGEGKEIYREELKNIFNTLQAQCVESDVIIKDEEERRNTVARQLDLLIMRLNSVKNAINTIGEKADIHEYDEFKSVLMVKVNALKQAKTELTPIMKEQANQSRTGIRVIRELSSIAGPEAIRISTYEDFITELGNAFEIHKAPKKLAPYLRALSDAYTCVPVFRGENLPEIVGNK